MSHPSPLPHFLFRPMGPHSQAHLVSDNNLTLARDIPSLHSAYNSLSHSLSPPSLPPSLTHVLGQLLSFKIDRTSNHHPWNGCY